MKEMYLQNDLRREAYFYKLDSMSHDTLLPVTGGYAYLYKFRKFYTERTDDGYIIAVWIRIKSGGVWRIFICCVRNVEPV